MRRDVVAEDLPRSMNSIHPHRQSSDLEAANEMVAGAVSAYASAAYPEDFPVTIEDKDLMEENAAARHSKKDQTRDRHVLMKSNRGRKASRKHKIDHSRRRQPFLHQSREKGVERDSTRPHKAKP